MSSRPRAIAAVFALCWGAALVPLWAPRYLPLLDWPNHLAAVALWQRYADASWGYQPFYELNLLPVPYWGFALPVRLLAAVVPVEVAGKLWLSAYALALPVGVALLARRLGRSPWLGLFGFPLAFNLSLGLGFVAFCTGLAVLFFALVALERFLEAPSRGRAVAVALVAVALYFCHVLPWLFFGVAATALLWGRPRRRALVGAALLVPSPIVAIVGFALARGQTAVQAGRVRLSGKWLSPGEALADVPRSLVVDWPGGGHAWVLIALAATWLALIVTSRRGGRGTARAVGLFAVAALFVVAMPVHLYQPVDLWCIGSRFVAVAGLFAALLPAGPVDGRRRLLLVPLVALCVTYPLLLAARWRAFDALAADFRRLLPHLRRGASTLVLVYKDGSDPAAPVQSPPYLMFHAYAQLAAGGFDPWALGTGFPMKVKDRLPAPIWRHPETFDFARHGRAYDYIITQHEIEDFAIFAPSQIREAELTARAGPWRLYAITARR